ncbi:MAG: hypothetical protein IJ150_13290 [Bacteroidales bacterium]|nr:hypothetical protein [Bacteroidales bacterium]
MATIISTKVKFKNTDREFPVCYLELNDQGNEILRKDFDESGNLYKKSVSYYNGENLKKLTEVFSPSDAVLEKVKFYYNRKNKEVSTEEYTFEDGSGMLKFFYYCPEYLMVRTINDFDEEIQRCIWYYDISKRPIIKSELNASGMEIKKTLLKYDSFGQIVQEEICGLEKSIYEYDNQNNKIIKTTFSSLGEKIATSVITRDDKNRIISEENSSFVKKTEYINV